MATKKTASKTTASKKATSEKSTGAAAPAKKAAKEAPVEAKVDVHAGAATKAAPGHAEIAKLAHRYWEERGGHHGSHVGDWLRAERELRGE